MLDVVRGLEEPVEEGTAVGLVGRHVAGELLEPDLRRLPRQGLHPVSFLTVKHILVRITVVALAGPHGLRRRPRAGAGDDNDENHEQNVFCERHGCLIVACDAS